jgi:hypothetical protein
MFEHQLELDEGQHQMHVLNGYVFDCRLTSDFLYFKINQLNYFNKNPSVNLFQKQITTHLFHHYFQYVRNI